MASRTIYRDAEFQPQKGFQQMFIGSHADICIGGGAAGAGKTIALLFSPFPYIQRNRDTQDHWDMSKFTTAIFRSTYGEIKMDGGMWDKSKLIYPGMRAQSYEGSLQWKFPSGAKVSFEHLGHERELYKYQGAEFNMIGLDEVTHYAKKSFMYLLTRNRSMSGIKPFMKCTCNPDPDSWLVEFLAWWINQDTGFPIMERAGVVRYMVMDQDRYIWGNSKQEVYDKAKHVFRQATKHGVKVQDMIKSVTFIPGNIYGNKELLKTNPGYLANLMAQDEETRSQLLEGNWKIRSDNMSLMNFMKIKDLGTNLPAEKGAQEYFIVIDHARFGSDLCVIGTWHGWKCIRIDILTKSDTARILEVVYEIRRIYRPLPMSNMVIDQDGIGVADSLGCNVFKGGAKAQTLKLENINVEANYMNFKTQCFYYLSDRINAGNVSVDFNNIYVDGVASNIVTLKGERREVKRLLEDELRIIRREKPDKEGKKMINNKEQQKNALDGRSPDLADMLNMRSYFDLWRRPVYLSI